MDMLREMKVLDGEEAKEKFLKNRHETVPRRFSRGVGLITEEERGNADSPSPPLSARAHSLA